MTDQDPQILEGSSIQAATAQVKPSNTTHVVVLQGISHDGEMKEGETREYYRARFTPPIAPSFRQAAYITYFPERIVRPYILSFDGDDPAKVAENVENRHLSLSEAMDAGRVALCEWAAGCLSWQPEKVEA